MTFLPLDFSYGISIDICLVCNRNVWNKRDLLKLIVAIVVCIQIVQGYELATQNVPWYCKSCTEGLFTFDHFEE